MRAKAKPRIIKTDSEYIYIPADCKERFLTPPIPSIQYLATQSILMAGISDLIDGYRLDRQGVSHHLMLYTLGGEGLLKVGDGETKKLQAGDIFIAPNRSSYSYWTDTTWNIAWLHLGIGSKWDNLIGSEAHVRKASWAEEMQRVMGGYIEESDRRRIDSGSALHSYVDLIVLYIQRELAGEDPLLADVRRKLEGLWNAVQHNLKYAWGIESMARLSGMSRSCFHRMVVELTGSTPMQVVNMMRMERAAEMLLYTSYTAAMVADEVGYENQFSFSKAFKRYSGLSPKQFREENGAFSDSGKG